MGEINYARLGERLKKAVEHSGKTAKLVCREADISVTTYQRYGHGDISPSLLNIIQIAEATGVDFTWLATGQGEMTAFSPNDKDRLRIRDLICDGLLQIDEAEKQQRKQISVKVKANILSDLVADGLKEGVREVDHTNVVRFVRYATGGSE